MLSKIVTNSFSKKIHFKFKVYKKDRSQLRSTHSVWFQKSTGLKRISKQRKLKVFTSINKRQELCLYFDEVSAILQVLHIRVLLSGSSGKMKFDSSSWYVKAGLLRFSGDHVRVFSYFANYTFCTLAPQVRPQNT